MQGSAIAKRLLAKGHTIVAPVRSAMKVDALTALGIEAFLSDFTTQSLSRALSKADQVVLQVPAQVASSYMLDFAKVAIDAILAAGYPKTVFVISSTLPDEKTGINSVDARVEMAAYARRHLPNTPIFSATEYLENFATAYRNAIEKDGVIPQTIPARYPVNYLAWDDLAMYVEAALETDRLVGRLYRIGGLEGINGNDLAERLGRILGKELHYVEISHEQLEKFLVPIMGEEVAGDYAAFYQYQDTEGQHLLNPDTAAIRQELGIQLNSFEEWAMVAFAGARKIS